MMGCAPNLRDKRQREVPRAVHMHALSRPRWLSSIRSPSLVRASIGRQAAHQPSANGHTAIPPRNEVGCWMQCSSLRGRLEISRSACSIASLTHSITKLRSCQCATNATIRTMNKAFRKDDDEAEEPMQELPIPSDRSPQLHHPGGIPEAAARGRSTVERGTTPGHAGGCRRGCAG